MSAIDGAYGLVNAEQCDIQIRRDKLVFGPFDFDTAGANEIVRIPIPTERMPWVLAGLVYTFEEASNATAGNRGWLDLGYEKEGTTLDPDGILKGLAGTDPGRLPEASAAVLGHQVILKTKDFTGALAASLKTRKEWAGMVVIPKASTLVLSKTKHGAGGTTGIINGFIYGWEVVNYEG